MRVKGSTLMGGLLLFTAVFSGALWYAQNYAYYEVTEAERFDLQMVRRDGEAVPAPGREFTILDAPTSPLKFRACFRMEEALPALRETYQPYAGADPLRPPRWFDCFDTDALHADLQAGRAVAFLGQRDIADGVDRVIAVYPDGRAYSWHQLNEKYAEE